MNKLSNIINPFLHNNYTQLAKVYKMKREKFSSIIEPIRDNIKVRDPKRSTLTCREVWMVVEYLGSPDPFDGIDPLEYNTITKLADLYLVDRCTFSRWLGPIKNKLKLEHSKRNKFTPAEIRLIVDHIGFPDLPENEPTQ